MVVKVTASCINWSQSTSSSSSPPSSKRRSLTDDPLIHRSPVFGNTLTRSRSHETLTLSRNHSPLKRSVSANFDSHFSREIHAIDFRFNFSRETHDSDPSASIERKANRVEVPFSLRVIKKKKQLAERLIETGELVHCSMKKAFSSMVFIIRELQSYTIQMREVLDFDELQEVLMRVHKEMNASFVWLFQQVFSHTPNLMVCVMILLANYSVYSMSNNVAVAAPLHSPAMDFVSMIEDHTDNDVAAKTIFVNSDGINGGGRKPRLPTSGTDGEGKFDGVSSSTINPARTGDESVSGQVTEDEETEITEDYKKTDMLYQIGLSKEPDNPLLLANYAQFLYLFAHDHKRAEVYFKKASELEPKDAETLSKYASFLWHAKNDLWAAEETFLEAISTDPSNSFYTAAYANFLWLNGGDDTCFPLDPPEKINSD